MGGDKMNGLIKITLRSARVNAGLNQKEAADRLHIGVSTLQGYEKGKRMPRWDVVLRIQRVYGIPYEHLIFDMAG